MTVERLPFPDLARLRTAAFRARRAFPGAVGELIHRELTAYADFGYRMGRDAVIDRLAAAVLAGCAGRTDRHMEPCGCRNPPANRVMEPCGGSGAAAG